jgi:hypothetical protein
MDEHSAIGNDAQTTKLMPTLGWAGDGEQLRGRVEQHGHLLLN